ncbi:Rtr1/RPAP2 family-domain-containing protein [Cokeromyces recurvatus]|uniref:Rtr1/RPAP2 family-domain-containing protein n=1 Tax=Cokeromyces recurvatus TaxID=90255 RepID=UPI0022207DAE|nr:Rtr1/RPAP2 family-domain-containing protein [Cokeromyces recurvatus]KAI7905605.1 Rtr1/RPAP2 family-domain-containing protein [Cokeromyces recurvatus]
MTANTQNSLELKSPKSLKKTPIRQKKKPLTPKQKLMKESAEHRLKIERLVFAWQEKLFSQPKIHVSILQRAATYLQPKTYAEVIEERVVQEWCGYPLCNQTPKTLQKYKISISQRKVYDQSELANYCSDACFHKSKYYNMQLSEEPVWFRDLNVISNAHVVSLEEDFQFAVEQQMKRPQPTKSNQELRDEYVHHLLGNISKDMKEQLQIVEKTPEVSSAINNQSDGVYDSIEGYRIEVKHDGKKPTTLILKKKEEKIKNEPIKRAMEPESIPDPDNPDTLFETMMMLKDMNMDKEDNPSVDLSEMVERRTQKVTHSPSKRQEEEEKTSLSTIPEKNQIEIQPLANETDKDTNIIKVRTTTSQKPNKMIKKKKKRIPELSLFGTIWTMLDHMTTRATRVYLNELQNTKQRMDVTDLLKEDRLIDEAIFLRGQIFSERILDTYGIIRAQLDIKENLEDDIINIIKTFKFSDASMVALDPAQCYMMALVFIKSLGDILLEDTEWKKQFEDCCKAINQSADMVDACVRVLKVASV